MHRNFLRTQRRRHKVSLNRVAEIQQLEPRALPTASIVNVVNVVPSGASFTLTGDDQANHVTVEVTTSGVTITAGQGTSLTIKGVADADGAFTIPIAAGKSVGDVNINLGGGDNTLDLNVDGGLGVRAIKSLSVNTGDGKDNVSFEVGSGTTLNFAGGVSISTGEGQDTLGLNLAGIVSVGSTLAVDTGPDSDIATIQIPGSLVVKGAASFLTGDGADLLSFTGAGAATFNNTLTINTGADADTLTEALAGGITVKGAATVMTGDGADQITFTNNSSTLNFQKGLTIDAGADANTVTIAGTSGTLRSGGDLVILTGTGNDHVTLTEKLIVDGGFLVRTGDGNDVVNLSTGTGIVAADGIVANSVAGNAYFDTGAGADNLNINVVPGTSLTVKGTPTITTGSGDDVVTLTNTGTTVTFASGLTIDTGTGTDSGSDHVTLAGGKLNVTGALKVTTGAQDDTVNISEAMNVSGDVNIDTGTGADTLALNLATAPVVVGAALVSDTSLGSLTINTGTGADDVSISTSSGATAQVVGLTNINTGSGNDRVNIDSNGTLSFLKDLTINTGLNDDRVRIEADAGSIHLSGNETVDLGDQNDGFLQGTATAINPILNPSPSETAAVSFQIDGNLSITGGTGNDTIGLFGVQVGKDRASPTAAYPSSLTTIDGGTGDDTIGVGSDVIRDLKILAGDGNDKVGGQDLNIRGTTTIDLGTGDDQFVIGGSSSLNGTVSILGGTGNDRLAIGSQVTLASGKTFAINGGAGTNTAENDSAISVAVTNWAIGTVDGAAIGEAIVGALQALFSPI